MIAAHRTLREIGGGGTHRLESEYNAKRVAQCTPGNMTPPVYYIYIYCSAAFLVKRRRLISPITTSPLLLVAQLSSRANMIVYNNGQASVRHTAD